MQAKGHPTTVPDDTAPHPTIVGEVLVVGERLLVCRYPVSTSLPIPLRVKAPAAAELLT